MNMNFNQFAAIQKAKEAVDRFRKNHPKFPPFIDTVGEKCAKGGNSDRNLRHHPGRNML